MFEPRFTIGQVVSNSDIVQEFRCDNMNGIRPSKTTQSVVIVANHTKGLYTDEWYGDTLHYCGMGKNGDQNITYRYNKTLNDSNNTGLPLYLFEVFEDTKYVFQGHVVLCDTPYQARQLGEDGLERTVWIFPLRPVEAVEVNRELLDTLDTNERKKARRLSDEELLRRAKARQKRKPASRLVDNQTVTVRDPYVAEYAKRRAKGICQLCDGPAPFRTKKGELYLESHHIYWLSDGGEDTIENTCALCPNCHRKMHQLNLHRDVVRLLKKAQKDE